MIHYFPVIIGTVSRSSIFFKCERGLQIADGAVMGSFRGLLTGVVWFSGSTADEAGSVLWLRVEDEDTDAAELLRVAVRKGKKRKMASVCKGISYKKEDEPMRE